jgi:PEP-CTERM motif
VIGAGGGSFVQSWGKDAGLPNTQTYGQTVTVPTDNILTSFSFWLGRTSTNFPDPSDVSLSFMAYVYEWNDGALMATGPALYTSGVYTHNATPATPFTEYTFSTGGLSLATGSMYALFLSTSGLAGDGHVQWEAATTDEYLGGNFIFQNNAEDTGEWTASPWGVGFASDLHFEANFTAATTVPEPATVALLSVALAGLGFSRRRKLH